jgi:hypothetical protein
MVCQNKAHNILKLIISYISCGVESGYLFGTSKVASHNYIESTYDLTNNKNKEI